MKPFALNERLLAHGDDRLRGERMNVDTLSKILSEEYDLARHHMMAYLQEPASLPNLATAEAAPVMLKVRIEAMQSALTLMTEALKFHEESHEHQ